MVTMALTITISANIVAWYAAIIATASALVSGYSVWRDRSRLKIVVRAGWRISEPYKNFTPDDDLIMIEAFNTGRRPIVLGKTTFSLRGEKKKGMWIRSDWEPKSTLNEGETATKLCFQRDIDLQTLSKVNIEDGTDRTWSKRLRLTNDK